MSEELEYRVRSRRSGIVYEITADSETGAHAEIVLRHNVYPAELQTISVSRPTPYLVPIDPMDGLECEGCQ